MWKAAHWLWQVWATVVFLFAIAGAAAADQLPPTEPAFTQMIAERLQKGLPDLSISIVGPLSLNAVAKDGGSLQINLDRIWAVCQRAPDRCVDASAEYVSGTATAVREYTRPVEKSLLRLVLRPDQYLKTVYEQFASRGQKLLVRPFFGGMSVAVVADLSRSIRFIHDRDLQTLGVTEEQAFDVAKHNLATALPPLSSVLKPVSGQAIGILDRDEYQPSRLIFHDDWRDEAKQLDDQLIVAVPTGNVLLYASGASRTAIGALRAFALEIARKTDRPLSPVVLKWTETGWDVVR